ncbi:MAG TPA: hypothetical protein VGQ51_00335 [Puia sp.]|jgi:hypothetical protein|nr:hypothetical protein [Puia sp.]
MAGINIGKAPKNNAVLPFYGTGAVFFLALTLMILFCPAAVSGHYFQPHLLAIVHTAALGWGTMVIFGASYQLLPVICEKELYSAWIALLSYFCLAVGAIFLILSFWLFRTGVIMIGGGSLILIAALLYLLNAWKTAGSCKKYSVQRCFIISSAIWLVVTASVGLVLAVNLRYPFIRGSHLEILKLHAHAGLAGWFLQLIAGVSTKLVPMFLLGKSDKEKLLRWAFLLQNTGLIAFILDGYFNGITGRVFFYEGMVLAGVIAWLVYLTDICRNRVKKKIDFQMKYVGISILALLISFLLIPAIFYGGDHHFAIVYGVFVFLGWISAIILGMTFKTLPFIVWNERYKNINGKVKIPMPKHLYKENVLNWQFLCYIMALPLLALGIFMHIGTIVRLSGIIWVMVAALYTYNVAVVIFHKRRV